MQKTMYFSLVLVLSMAVGGLAGYVIGVRSVVPENLAGSPPAARPQLPPGSDGFALERFHKIWYLSDTWRSNRWMGIPTEQNPMDAWIIQEIIFDTKPDFIIEAGAYHGGSAALWAMVLSQVNPAGRVISIDIEDRMQEARQLPIVRERVDFLIGSSVDEGIVREVKRRVAGKKTLLVEDSLHRKDHVLKELRAYAPLIQPGGYMVVEDTNISGHPVGAPGGQGPYEAVEAFLAENKAFVADTERERLLFTFCPHGFLKRVQ